MSTTFPDQHAAKAFFIDRVKTRASEEGAPLSRAQVHQFAFSEAEPGFEFNQELLDEFEAETDQETFEVKIRGLLERAYKHDTGLDESAHLRYHEAYKALKAHDHYILVMINDALGSKVRSPKKRRWLLW
jgi:hypothetical protein